MRVLLDTHALLWLIGGDDRVPAWLRKAGQGGGIETRISHVSIWEIAIKRSLGRLEVDADLPDRLEALGVHWLEMRLDHLWGVADLPHHHRDPFDRLLISQALRDDLVIATADSIFTEYGVPIRW